MRFFWVAVLSLSFAQAGAKAQSISKKGVAIGARDLGAAEKIGALRVGWYYTWSTSAISGVRSAEFVPMIWGRKVPPLKRSCRLLLANEPDSSTQSNMLPKQALEVAAAARPKVRYLGSPAPVNGLGKWLESFNAEAVDAGIKYDFIAMHWYGAPALKPFLRKIDAVYARYQRPIWITEFAVADWSAKRSGVNRYTPDQVLSFMTKALPELERRNYVHRYAWMGAGTYTVATQPSRLFDRNGAMTRLGQAYSLFHSKRLNASCY